MTLNNRNFKILSKIPHFQWFNLFAKSLIIKGKINRKEIKIKLSDHIFTDKTFNNKKFFDNNISKTLLPITLKTFKSQLVHKRIINLKIDTTLLNYFASLMSGLQPQKKTIKKHSKNRHKRTNAMMLLN